MKYLFFAPYQNIWQHSFPEAIIAKSLKENGHDVTYIGCKGILSDACPAMQSVGVQYNADKRTKQKICRSCKKRANLNVRNANVSILYIDELISEDELNSINNKITNFRKEKDLVSYYNSKIIHKYASYLVLLNYKLNDVQLVLERHLNEYLGYLKNCLIVEKIASKLLLDIQPSSVFIYNTFYPTNKIFEVESKRKKIPVYWLHAGGNLSNRLGYLNIGKGDNFSLLSNMLLQWFRELKMKPASEKGIEKVKEHYLQLIKGNSFLVYSSNEMGKTLEIPSEKKVLLAVMSSEDERVAAREIGVIMEEKEGTFKDQASWLDFLIEYSKNKKDVFLIIRVHPREFSNENNATFSENSKELKRKFKNLPSNVIINWPDQKISLYQLFKSVDVCLHFGSSAGKEAALLGIPTVSSIQSHLFYPYNISFYGETIEEYEIAVTQALASGWSIETARNAFRWCALELYDSLWKIDKDGEALGQYEMTKDLGLVARIKNKIARYLDDCHREKVAWKVIQPFLEYQQFEKMLISGNVAKTDLLTSEIVEPNEDREPTHIIDTVKDIIHQLYPEGVHKKKSGVDMKLYSSFSSAMINNTKNTNKGTLEKY